MDNASLPLPPAGLTGVGVGVVVVVVVAASLDITQVVVNMHGQVLQAACPPPQSSPVQSITGVGTAVQLIKSDVASSSLAHCTCLDYDITIGAK
jgi:hypothetical protein